MSISKIQFEQIMKAGEKLSFKELDLNNDGKIDKADEALAKDNNIKNHINSIVDEEPSIQSAAADNNNTDFNEDIYLQNKMKQLNAVKSLGRDNWTTADVKKAFSDAGFTSEQHYELYGKNEGISPKILADDSVNELFVFKAEQNIFKSNLEFKLSELQIKKQEIAQEISRLNPEDPAANALKEMQNFLDTLASMLVNQQNIAAEMSSRVDEMIVDGKATPLELQIVDIHQKQAKIAYDSSALAFANPEDPAVKQLAEVNNILDVQRAHIETAIRAGKTDSVEYSQSGNDVNFKALSERQSEQITYKNNIEYQLSQLKTKKELITFELMNLAFVDPSDSTVKHLKAMQSYLDMHIALLEKQEQAAIEVNKRTNEMTADGKVTNLELQLLEIFDKQAQLAYQSSALAFTNPEDPAVKQIEEVNNILNTRKAEIEAAIQNG